jgi:uncharacterized protein YndB with AHSA1/START domain
VSGPGGQPAGLTLIVRRLISAPSDRLFAAWTEADQFVRWWGPKGVVCESADIDLRVGGLYRIANRLPDGRLVWISGAFELIDRPNRIDYSWQLEPGSQEASRVVVLFVAKGDQTEVVVTHQRIASEEVKQDHERGWIGCLERLEAHFGGMS